MTESEPVEQLEPDPSNLLLFIDKNWGGKVEIILFSTRILAAFSPKYLINFYIKERLFIQKSKLDNNHSLEKSFSRNLF